MPDRMRPTGSDSVARSDGGTGRFLSRQEATGTYAQRAGGTSSPVAPLPFFNVRDYGAKGDGTTDDTAAFLAAITAAAGKPVQVPAGSYPIALNLTDQDVHLFGRGTLLHQQGQNLINCRRTIGSSIAVTQGVVQFGPNLPSASVSTETYTKLTVGSGGYTGFAQGDIYHISSQDSYGWSATTGAGNTIWQTAFVPILGIGMDVSAIQNGGPAEGSVMVGGTSGASAVVQSVIVNGTAAQVLFEKLTADFASGEALTIAGTAVGTAGSEYLVMAGKLIDTYSTSPVIRKMPTGTFIIDGLTIKASGDTDAIVGAANRLPALQLAGVVGPVIKNVRISSAWTRCIQLLSCYQGDIDVYIDRLPNNTLTTEAAYGYGVEFAAATEACRIKVIGRNLRHAVTSNIFWGGFQFMDPLSNGVPKYNVIHDSLAINPFNAGFDLHSGAYYTVFDNCHTIFPASGNRFQSGAVGFQNRGFGTIFRNCRAQGATVGFVENAMNFEAGFVHVISYRDCIADGYQQFGFQQISNSAGNNAKLELINFTSRGDGSAVNVPYAQVGIAVRGGVINIQGGRSERFNNAPLRITDTGRVTIVDFLADYMDAASGTSGLRVDATMGELNIFGYKVRSSPFGSTSPTYVFRNAAGNTVWNLDAVTASNLSGANPPALMEVNGGTPAVNIRSLLGAVRPVTYVGDANATLTPRTSSVKQVWNTALTANRTVTLPTTAGTVINGDSFRVVRTANSTGAFTLTVAGKALSAGQWADVVFDGTAWLVDASGSL